MRILLTEDDPQLGRATQIGLEQGGYAVDWVTSAEQAHTAVRLHDYGCILLDPGLPGQDGMQALGVRIRSACRRAAGRLRENLVHGDLVLDIAHRHVTQGGRA